MENLPPSTEHEQPLVPQSSPLNTGPEKPNVWTQLVQLTVVVLVLALLAYFVISFVMQFIWWVVSVLAIGVLMINYKLLGRVVAKLKEWYQKNTWLGIGGTVAAVAAFVPFVGFLFLKTIWDFRKSDFLPGGRKKDLPPGV
jgi:hypothetical protein